MPPWATKLPWEIIERYAATYNLSSRLIAAIIQNESRGLTKSARLEPGWPYYFKPKEISFSLGITEETEKSLQRHSWGLCQVMGAVARELGFRGFLPDLCDPGLGILFGCKKLQQLVAKYPNQDDVISAYNRGTPGKTFDGTYYNQIYVNNVNGFLNDLKAVNLPK